MRLVWNEWHWICEMCTLPAGRHPMPKSRLAMQCSVGQCIFSWGNGTMVELNFRSSNRWPSTNIFLFFRLPEKPLRFLFFISSTAAAAERATDKLGEKSWTFEKLFSRDIHPQVINSTGKLYSAIGNHHAVCSPANRIQNENAFFCRLGRFCGMLCLKSSAITYYNALQELFVVQTTLAGY